MDVIERMVHGWRSDALTPMFEGLSFLGDATFFLIAFTLGYWLVHREVFLRVSVVLMITVLCNSWLKGTFQLPRPDETLRLVTETGWSFPSGHAMVAAAVWPWLAGEVTTRWPGRRGLWTAAWALAVLVPLGIATSRIYLGVHDLRDVTWGLALGAGLACVLWWLADMMPAVWWRLRWRDRVALVAVPVAILLLVVPVDDDPHLARAGGALIGLVLGLDLERRAVRFTAPRGWLRIAAAAFTGLAGVFTLRVGLAAGFDALGFVGRPADALRYLVIALFFAWAAPWIFVRCGWAGQEAAVATIQESEEHAAR